MRKLFISALLTLPLATGCEPPPASAAPSDVAAADPATPAADAATADTSADAATKTGTDEPNQDNLPQAEDALAKSVEAVGGKAKIDSIKSFYSETAISIASQNMELFTKMWWRDGNFYSETDMPGVGLTRVWNTPKGTWSDDPINGMREVTGKEAQQMAWSNALVLPASWKEFFSKAETKARRREGDKVLVDILLTSEDASTMTMSIDESTWLVRSLAFTQSTPMGDMPITVQVKDYKDFDGFRYAVLSSMDMGVASVSSSVTKFEPNADVNDKRLALPKDAAKKPAKKPAKTK